MFQSNNIHLENKPDQQIHTIKQLNQGLNKDSTTPVPLTRKIMILDAQNSNSKLSSMHNHNFISDNAVQVRFPQNKSAHATRNYNPNSDNQHAARVRFTQNHITPSQQNSNLKSCPYSHYFQL